MESRKKIKHKVLQKGAIEPLSVAGVISKHSSNKDIGAHNIFLGQVRGDTIGGKTVTAIEYLAYEEMAEERFDEIRETAFAKFDISCVHIYHSLGVVKAGEICLFVFVASGHRQAAFDACRWIVDEVKKTVPVWGKEVLEDNSYVWKENKL